MMHPSRPWLGLYKTKRWTALRMGQLRKCPLCRFCSDMGKITAANVVDHIKPHKGDVSLFHDAENLQSLCKLCHDSAKARMENSGDFGCNTDGIVKGWQ